MCDYNMLSIREAKIKDLEKITEIYNEAILKTTATFDTQIKTFDEQKVWFKTTCSHKMISDVSSVALQSLQLFVAVDLLSEV